MPTRRFARSSDKDVPKRPEVPPESGELLEVPTDPDDLGVHAPLRKVTKVCKNVCQAALLPGAADRG